MKSMMIKTTLREIKQSLGRYLAIFAIVALGVVMFAGLKVCKEAMLKTGYKYLGENNFYDYRLISTIGFEAEDIEEIKKIDGVVSAEGAIAFDVIELMSNGGERVVATHSITTDLNKLVLVAGRLPESDRECVADSFYESEGIIGSEFVLAKSNDEDTLDKFKYESYTIVGLVQSPTYLNYERGSSSIGNGSVSNFIYLNREAYDCDYDTEVFLKMNVDEMLYSDAYNDYIDAHTDIVTDKVELVIDNRFDRLVADAWEEINDAKKELADKVKEAEEELADAYEKLLDGEKEIADAKIEIADAEKEIADGEIEIAENEQKILDAEKEIADGEIEIAENEQKLIDAEKEIADAEIEIADNEQKIIDGEKELLDADIEIKDAIAQISDGDAKLNEAYDLVLKKADELEAAKVEVKKNRDELNAGIAQIDAGVEELNANIAILSAIPLPEYQAQAAVLSATRDGLIAKRAELVGMYALLDDAEKEIAAGEFALATACAGIAEKKQEINDAVAELSEAIAKYEDGKKELEDGKKELEDGKAELEKAKLEVADGKVELEKAKQELLDGKKELEDGKQELLDGKKELEDGKTELLDAKEKLADAEKELADGYAEYEDGKKTLAEEVADAEAEIKDAEDEINNLKEPDVYVLDRTTNIGYACFENDSSIVDEIAAVFPIFFFAVAVLVCMTTMTRMIEDQRTQIGVLKALGYSEAKIMGKYLFYSGSAATGGAIFGFILGTYMFPKVIWVAYGMMYGFAELDYVFNPLLAVISLAAAMLCSMGATYFSCASQLLSVPASLIRPKAPKSGKRIFLEYIGFVWKRLKFLQKVSIRNVFRYQKRFIMMVLGISGCTALLLTAMGLNDSIKHVVTDQYDEISTYDVAINLAEEVPEDEMTEFRTEIEKQLDSYVFLNLASRDIISDTGTKSANVVVPEDAEAIGTKFRLYDAKTREPMAYPGLNEAVLSEKLAKMLGLNIGDIVVIQDPDMNRISVTVSGLCRNYVYSYIFITKETYESQIGEAPKYKTIYADFKDGLDEHEAAAALSDVEHVGNCTVSLDFKDRFTKMMVSLNYVIIMVIVCAAALAFIVLYNLTNINITERIREIATIKVLGFYPMETASYVFRENIILTTFGALFGLILGKWLHLFVMNQIDIDVVSFGTDISLFSFIVSIALTYVFAGMVNIVMYFKLERINMAESLKSIE